MKKYYISPETTHTEIIIGSIVCASGDGTGTMTPPGEKPGTGNDAPRRRVFF